MYLASSNLDISRSRIKQLIEEGLVTVGGRQAKASYHVRAGDAIEVNIPTPREAIAEPEDIPLDVIYEDGDIIVVNKPVGMVVHPAAGNLRGTLVNALLGHCTDLSGIGGELKPGIVHRLDKDTSGVMVVAKTDPAHLYLSRQFKARLVKKIYGAVVYGAPKGDAGTIDKPIGRSMTDRKRMSTRTKKGRIARTEWRVVERFGKYLAWLMITLKTGRTHQIRVHLADIGHPLVGDPTYGRGGPHRVPEGALRDAIAGFSRPALHAWKLGFTHPRKHQWMEFEAPLPSDINNFLEQLRHIKLTLGAL